MLKIILFLLVALVSVLWIASFVIARSIEREFPPIGQFATLDDRRLHYVDTGKGEENGKPALVFIHGASGNLRDPLTPYRDRLSEEFRMIFVDRPGHGYSDPFPGSNNPKQQAAAIEALIASLGIERVIVVGHSFGGVVAAAFGVAHPERTAGLVLLAPVSHPWGTGVDWHYDVGNTPIIGWLFSRLIVPVAGLFIYPEAVRGVFEPNEMPADYRRTSATKLVLRPHNFHENAKDVARVEQHVTTFHHRYREISAPTAIFHGTHDDIVSLEIHSVNGLSRDIENSRLYVLEGVGHKPDYVAVDKISDEIRRIALEAAANR